MCCCNAPKAPCFPDDSQATNVLLRGGPGGVPVPTGALAADGSNEAYAQRLRAALCMPGMGLVAKVRCCVLCAAFQHTLCALCTAAAAASRRQPPPVVASASSTTNARQEARPKSFAQTLKPISQTGG
jgi:hypothetical protein